VVQSAVAEVAFDLGAEVWPDNPRVEIKIVSPASGRPIAGIEREEVFMVRV
jgi:hypothetical protein